MNTKHSISGLNRFASGVLVLVFTLLLSCVCVFAQGTSSGALGGTVSDAKGDVIKGATVTVTNKATGMERTATTNDDGAYKLDFLPAGRYSVKVSSSGFGEVTSDNVELLVGQTNNFNVTMNPGVQTANVTVTADTELVSKEKTDVGMNITPRDVQDLPLNGRDLGNLAYLAPGAKPVDSYDPTKRRISVFGINGSSGRNVNVTVNGIDNKDNTVGGPVMQFPLESIQEFIISTARFSAVNGRSEGAAVNVVTKSGGNEFHGSLFYFLRDKKLNASEVSPTNTAIKSKPPFNRKQWGGAIGGPLYLPKFGEGGKSITGNHQTYFFFALERQNEATSIPVDSEAFTELNLVRNLGAQPAQNLPTPYKDWRLNARIDHTFNSKHNIFASFSNQSNIGLNDQANGRVDLTEGNFTTNRLILGNVTLNSALTSTVVNSATVGYSYWHNLIDSETSTPFFSFPSGISFGTNVNVPQESYQSKYQFKDDLSISRGAHTFRTGFDYLYEPKLGGFFKFNSTLEIDFTALPSKILSNPGDFPLGFSSRGAVGGMTIAIGDPYFNLPGGAKMFGVYFQDDWKVTRNVTLNLGGRWDKDFNLIGTQAQGRSRTYLALKAINHLAARSLPKDDSNNFSPRVGFAWDMRGNGRHLLRGGYGLYYGQVFLNVPLFMIQQINPTIFAGVFSLGTNDIVPGTGIVLKDWRFGIDPFPTIPPPQTQLTANNTGRIMDPDYQDPFTQQWNVGYAWQLNSYSVLEFDYTHILGLHESKTLNINPTRRIFCANGGTSCGVGPQDPNGQEIASRPLTAAFTAAGQPALGRIDLEASVGRSRYDGMNISYRRRLHDGVTVNATYTLSRALAYNGNSAAFRNRAWDPFSYFAPYEYGPTPNDSRHRISMGSVFNLPGGFQVAPIVQWETGRPYTAGYGTAVDTLGVGAGRGTSHVVVFKSSPTDLKATLTAFGDPSLTFAVPQTVGPPAQVSNAVKYRNCLRSGLCTHAAFDTLRGQPFFQLDARVTKNFKIGERSNLQAIFQVFDLNNRANFGNNFVTDVRQTTFATPSNFITPSGVTVPHSLSAELGLRFSF
jgi:hypothetical protein